MRRLLPILALVLGLALLPACGDKDDAAEQGAAPTGGGAPRTSDSDHGLKPELRAEIAAAMKKGRDYLRGQQGAKGGFGDSEIKLPENVSYTAMAVTAIVAATPSTKVSADQAIRKGLAFLVGFQQENGSIVDNPKITNYATSASVTALAAAKIGEHAKVQAKAVAYIKGSQITDDPKSLSFGGFPYKSEQSADGSNALIASNALDDDGLPDGDAVRVNVGRFVARLQNHSETNTGERVVTVGDEQRVVVSGPDGGGFYRADESKAGMVKRSDGRWELRSYGSMTYAVLKLLLFAGVQADDPRVAGVVRWMSNNWMVARNPGFENAEDPEKAGQQGMFYYLYTATRALAAYEKASGKPLVVTSHDGRTHNWRTEIARELLSRQADDGSWRNEVAERWEEGSKTLATSFAMQTFGWLTGRFN